MPNPIEYPFEHPAAREAKDHFLTLGVYSEADYRRLPRRDRYVWDVRWFETEVMNGGVDQFFWNSAGDHAGETLEALKAIGADQSYRLLRQASDLFPGQVPSPDFEVRRNQLSAIHGVCRRIDDRLSGAIEINLYQLLMDYWHQADPGKE